jgi:hypothetical protein
MKRFVTALLIASVLLPPTDAAAREKHLFILSGQSNMAGLDPTISFTPTVKAAFGENIVTVVKDAKGGQPIRRWYKKWGSSQGEKPENTGDLYDQLMKKVDAAVEGNRFTTVTFVWMQGETDAREGHGDVYAESLRGLIKQLSDDLGRADINFVVGRISDFDTDNQKFKHWTMVREAQVEVAESDSRGAWVNTDDLNEGKNKRGEQIETDLQYSVEGYKTLGKRFAERAIELIKSNTGHRRFGKIEGPKLTDEETDKSLHSDGDPWNLHQAKIEDPTRPRVLLIGDSILNGYRGHVQRELEGEAYVDAWVNPYFQSEKLNSALAEVLAYGPYDVVHFNMGLHGWQEGRIKPGEFKPLTRAYVEVLRSKLPDAKLIWASSTPVTVKNKPLELDPTINPIIVEHNRRAAEVMDEIGVPVSDFYGLLVNKRELARGDSFHWTSPAYRILGERASQSIRAALNTSGATE